MNDKACRTDHVFWNDKAPDEEHSFRFHAENPQDRQEELQHSPEKKAVNLKQKSRAGIFSRLQKRLKSRFEGLPAKRTASSVKAISISSDVEAGGEGASMKHKKRASYYRCLPNPPGCIPTEVMIRVEGVFYSPPLNRPGQGERSTAIDGTNHKEDGQNRSKNGQENASFSTNV